MDAENPKDIRTRDLGLRFGIWDGGLGFWIWDRMGIQAHDKAEKGGGFGEWVEEVEVRGM